MNSHSAVNKSKLWMTNKNDSYAQMLHQIPCAYHFMKTAEYQSLIECFIHFLTSLTILFWGQLMLETSEKGAIPTETNLCHDFHRCSTSL